MTVPSHTHTHSRIHGNDAVKNLCGGEHLGKAQIQYVQIPAFASYENLSN
jgi:hypothetical protein